MKNKGRRKETYLFTIIRPIIKFIIGFLKTLILLFFIGIFGYLFKDQIHQKYLQISQIYFPCSNPISYKIGSFDNRFSISQKDFLDAINKATLIWESPIHKNLFVYSSSGDLKINLVYDYRQEAMQKLERLGYTITDSKQSYDIIKTKYESLSADYNSRKSELELMINNFQIKKQSYENEVNYWNANGGAPETEYGKINQEKNNLENLTNQIKQKQTDFNAMVDTINSLASVLNKLANVLNLNVERYNSVGLETGQEFEEGNYASNDKGISIDIYQFNNKQELARVLAHELGHALGLEHLDNPQAIMYKYNQSKNEKLTEDDLLALKNKCNIK